MSIHPFVKHAVFDPTAIHAMALAFDDACKSLQVAPDAELVREIIAKQVIVFAQGGERDPKKLQAATLKALNLEQ
jgi:hypothetical protein